MLTAQGAISIQSGEEAFEVTMDQVAAALKSLVSEQYRSPEWEVVALTGPFDRLGKFVNITVRNKG